MVVGIITVEHDYLTNRRRPVYAVLIGDFNDFYLRNTEMAYVHMCMCVMMIHSA